MHINLLQSLPKAFYKGLWHFHLKAGDKLKGVGYLSKAFYIDNQDTELGLLLGETYQEQGMYDEALVVYDFLFPCSDIRVHNGIISAYLSIGRDKEAAEAIEKLLQINSFSEASQTNVLSCISELDDVENIIKYFSPLNDFRWHQVIGKIYFQCSKFENAIPFFERHAASDVNNTAILNILATCHFQCANYLIAENLFNKIIETNPDDLQAVLCLAMAQYSRDKRSGTKTCLDLLTKDEKYFPGLFQLGHWKYIEKDYGKAAEYLRRAVRTDALSSQAHFLLGKVLMELKSNEEAAYELELAYCLNDELLEARILAASLFHPANSARGLSIIEDTLGNSKHQFNPALLHEKAKYLHHLKNLDGALDALSKALLQEQNSAVMLSTFAALLRENGETEKAYKAIQRAELLAPNDLDIWINKGIILCDLGRGREAEELFDGALQKWPDGVEIKWYRAIYYLSTQKFQLGWLDYETRSDRKDFIKRDFGFKTWTPASKDSVVLAIREQGLGDEIMFASCIPDLCKMADKVILECHPQLVSLFERSFPSVQVVPNHDFRDTAWAKTGYGINSEVPCGSLPKYFRNSLESFGGGRPYLKTDPLAESKLKDKLIQFSGKRLVGISWRGGTYATRSGIRTIPIDMLGELFSLPDTIFFNLQYGDIGDELKFMENKFGINIYHDERVIKDYDLTATLVTCLDVVVSVQTSLVHLCGALGVPVLCMLPKVPEWRYGYTGDSMPWYSSVKLIRQASIGDWAGVLKKVRSQIERNY